MNRVNHRVKEKSGFFIRGLSVVRGLIIEWRK